jgi:hypothetical protein
MTAPWEPFVGLGRKFLHGRLGKKMATKEVPNLLTVWSNTSSDDERTSCDSIERHLIEASVKGRVVENALIDMVGNEDMEGANLFPTIEGGDYGHKEDGNGPTMDEGMPNIDAFIDPFGKISKLEAELAASRALVEEYKAKIEQLEHDLQKQQNIVVTLCGQKH